MDHPRMATPLMATCFGLFATIGWMAVLAYGTFQITKWVLIELAELLL
jgi:hypothetical protein